MVVVGALARLTRTTGPGSSSDHAVWTGDCLCRIDSLPTMALHDTELESGTDTLRKMKLAWLIEARATCGEKRAGDAPALANARPLALLLRGRTDIGSGATESIADRTR